MGGEGRRLRGEAPKMAKLEGGCEIIEDADKTALVMGVTRLKYGLLVLGRLTEDLTLPQKQLRE